MLKSGTYQNRGQDGSKLLPPWLIVIAAVFLLYMAWYIYQSDGTQYYVSPDYEVTEYLEITEGRYEALIEYPEEEMRELGLMLKTGDNAPEDAQLLVELTGEGGVDESWTVTAGEAASGEMTWLSLENPDIQKAQTLCLVLSVFGEDADWWILVGYNTAEDADGEDEEEYAEADTSAAFDATNTGIVYSALVSSVGKGLICLIAALMSILIFAVFAWISTKPSEERLFLALWLMLGTVYMIAQPVMSEADSRTHYYRSSDVAEGRWVTEQDEDGNWIGYYAMPESWVDDGNSSRVSTYEMLDYLDFSVDGEKTFFTYVNTAVYSPFTYIAQAIGIFLARLFTDRLVVIVYAGRITNFLLIGMVYWLAVRMMPFSKKYIIWSALIPMNLHEAVSLSPDAMVSALIALLMAAVLYLRYDPKSRPTAKMLVLLYVTAFLITQDKIVYVGACMLLFLIPPAIFVSTTSTVSAAKKGDGIFRERKEEVTTPQSDTLPDVDGPADATRREQIRDWVYSRRRYLMHVVMLGVLIIVASLGWLMIATRGLIGQYSDSHGQLTILLTQPVLFVAAVARSVLRRSGTYLNQMLGMYFGPFLVENDMVLMYAVLAMIAGIALVQFLRKRRTRTRDAIRVGWTARLNLVITSGLVLLLIFVSEYLLWTNYMGRYVDGIQGRYFIPVVPLLLVAIFGLQKNDMEKERAQYALLVGLNLCMALNAAVSWLYLTGSTVLY